MQKKLFLEMFYYRIILYGFKNYFSMVKLIARLKLNYTQNSLQNHFYLALFKNIQPCEFTTLIALMKREVR